MRAGTGLALPLMLWVAGCGLLTGHRSSRPQALAGTLEVAVARDTVWLTLHATNVSGEVLALRFANAQRYDFEVRTPTGASVWRWSSGRVFAEAAAEDQLEPGASRQWRGAWPVAGRAGSYVAWGRLLAQGHGVELSAAFELGRQ